MLTGAAWRCMALTTLHAANHTLQIGNGRDNTRPVGTPC